MKFIELVVNNKTFLVKAERVKDKIWFHLNDNIFTIEESNIRGGDCVPYLPTNLITDGETTYRNTPIGKQPPVPPPSVEEKAPIGKQPTKWGPKPSNISTSSITEDATPSGNTPIGKQPTQWGDCVPYLPTNPITDGETTYRNTPIGKQPASRVQAPMPGKVVKIQVKLNEKVEENQSLIILSSMKMEYFIKSEKKGMIKSIHVKEGDNVSAEQVLIEID